ncbi:MAG: inositol monophosphatase [Candidatus Margulisbacteria bacterium]|nr:inositol monophosphatase [Candidatus Margulisiibacteriota bacterium]
MYAELLNKALKAALLSGEILVKYEQKKINSSSGKDIKLQADIDSEKILIDSLKETNINILSEETGLLEMNHNSDLLWIVDPLDGSLNYSRDIPLNCISIALWNKNEPILGVIYDFNHNKMYKGIVGEGAFVNKKKIHVSDIYKKSNSVITTGFPVYFSFEDKTIVDFIKTVKEYKKIRLLGSAALSLSLVANGSVEAYSEQNIAFWDVAAGIALVKAAGGKVKYKFVDIEKKLMNVFVTNK